MQELRSCGTAGLKLVEIQDLEVLDHKYRGPRFWGVS